MAPALQFDPELLLKAQGIRLVLLDVDGVLTDGGMYFSATGESIKRFHVQDGLGLVLLRQAGILPVVVSGRDSEPLRLRLRELGIEHTRLGVADKLAAAQSLLAQLGMPWSDTAAIGDDWPDLPLLRRSAFSAAPSDAHLEVRAVVDHVTPRAGGQGAVRDLCDLLLVACGRYVQLLDEART
jgi:3-deoxy-D-manno-octulosonate 8-phosphate phosphatase (KDO 8-P phosphatase)